MLTRRGDTEVMTDENQMVMFYLQTWRRFNLVRLILDFIISSVHTDRRRHFTLPYGLLMTRVSPELSFQSWDTSQTIIDP